LLILFTVSIHNTKIIVWGQSSDYALILVFGHRYLFYYYSKEVMTYIIRSHFVHHSSNSYTSFP
ncbi:hypothetical protein KSZ88_03480, partial [Bacteroides thetaiotaomicron]